MKIDRLLHKCAQFEKIAQSQQRPPTAKASDANFWGKLLYHAIQSYANMLTSPVIARQVFNDVVSYMKSPATASNATVRKLGEIDAAIKESMSRLSALNLDPIVVLTKMGAANLNPNSLNVLLSNLKVLQEGQNFDQYQHYYLQPPGQPKEVIDLDQDTGPGY